MRLELLNLLRVGVLVQSKARSTSILIMNTNTVSIYVTVFAADCCHAKLIEGPKSTSALLGEVSSFNCSGIGAVYWFVNGFLGDDDSFSERGISSKSTTTSTGNFLSQLNVPATVENNKINIFCVVVEGDLMESSGTAVLEVLGKLQVFAQFKLLVFLMYIPFMYL